MPTAYYEQTTPYGDYHRRNKNEDYNFDDDSFNAFDDDDNMDNIIEAFNPNVKVTHFKLICHYFLSVDSSSVFALKIPRPKIQLNPMKIFKFGPKNTENSF